MAPHVPYFVPANMTKPSASEFTRRQVLQIGAGTLVAFGAGEIGRVALAEGSPSPTVAGFKPLRSINIMNFLRGEEPRGPVDLMAPLVGQMEQVKKHGFPASWLLQFDALVSGQFVEYLKKEMPANHEVGFWFEMNHKLCDAAGVEWRGRPDWGWDYHVPVAYLIGYTHEERIKLAVTAMREFKKIWGRYPASIASWNLDAVTVGYLSDHYPVDAFAVCRDQDSTDGFTIWGAPIAGYYPCRNNAWSPAVEARNQIHTPILRLLGQDPVYYYDLRYPVDDGAISSAPDTMEPVWPSGRSKHFVDTFFDMIAHTPCLAFSYAQLGQENSFGWPDMRDGFAMQMTALAELRDAGALSIETMGETGRRFKSAFPTTPPQAQVQLTDPFGHDNPAEKSIWYQSRFYRANLHSRGSEIFLRDIAVYSDRLRQPYLDNPTRIHGIEQRLPAVLDALHWSDGKTKCAGRFVLINSQGDTSTIEATSFADVRESGSTLEIGVPIKTGGVLHLDLGEHVLSVRANDLPEGKTFALDFQWAHDRTSFVSIEKDRLNYRFESFNYSVKVMRGHAEPTAAGVRIDSVGNEVRLDMRQT